ncbi:MAG: hypothetical protein KKF33_13765 [Alphaproteobacteria bacterium]|nr:hypothetical protein [Alphaproteobacteria bacterium]
MIRYASTKESIEQAVDDVNDTWRTRATKHTRKLLDDEKYSEGGPKWSDIKSAFMSLQYHKCIFCECPEFERQRGTYNLDVEHFRPKNAVEPWPKANAPKQYPFATGGVAGAYYWLAFDPCNYAASCKECNSRYKSNFFPIAGVRGLAGVEASNLQAEGPFLCFPLGDWDEDPELLIDFDGLIARPASADPARRRRAEVIIDFFALNEREALQIERALFITLFAPSLTASVTGIATPKQRAIAAKVHTPAAPHANCLRSFERAMIANPRRGREIVEKAQEVVFDSIEI